MSLAKPDILQNVGLMPTDPSVNVTTSILEPVVHTDTMCRFVLENKGRLHGNSKITLGLNTPDKKAFFPINVGVHAVINRVCLKFGAKVISEITDFAHWMAYRGCFRDIPQVADLNNYSLYILVRLSIYILNEMVSDLFIILHKIIGKTIIDALKTRTFKIKLF